MIQRKLKICKGTSRAINHGCGQKTYHFRYGLCRYCFREWLYTTDLGKELLAGTIIKAKKKVRIKPKRKYIKWEQKEFQDMKKYIQDEICNPYIRIRDFENYRKCISSGHQIEQAGHYFSVGSTEKLRFVISNIHGQSIYSNMHLGGDLINYKNGLIKRHGQKYFNDLEKLKVDSQKWFKLDKSELINIGKTYEYLTKKRIWCYSHIEFENYKNIINK